MRYIIKCLWPLELAGPTILCRHDLLTTTTGYITVYGNDSAPKIFNDLNKAYRIINSHETSRATYHVEEFNQ